LTLCTLNFYTNSQLRDDIAPLWEQVFPDVFVMNQFIHQVSALTGSDLAKAAFVVAADYALFMRKHIVIAGV
jgi:hypothetical protein